MKKVKRIKDYKYIYLEDGLYYYIHEEINRFQQITLIPAENDNEDYFIPYLNQFYGYLDLNEYNYRFLIGIGFHVKQDLDIMKNNSLKLVIMNGLIDFYSTDNIKFNIFKANNKFKKYIIKDEQLAIDDDNPDENKSKRNFDDNPDENKSKDSTLNNGGYTDYYLIPKHNTFSEFLLSRKYNCEIMNFCLIQFIRLINLKNDNRSIKTEHIEIYESIIDALEIKKDNKTYNPDTFINFTQNYINCRFNRALMGVNTGTFYLQDLFEAFNINYALGNIIKSIYTYGVGRHSGTDKERETNKIIFFCKRQIKLLKGPILDLGKL